MLPLHWYHCQRYSLQSVAHTAIEKNLFKEYTIGSVPLNIEASEAKYAVHVQEYAPFHAILCYTITCKSASTTMEAPL